MTLSIVLMLLVIVVAMVLFSLERLPADVTAIGVLLILVLAGLLPPEEAFAGFGSDAVIMIFGLLVLTSALVRTGVVDRIGRVLLRFTGEHPELLLLVIMLAAAGLSALISNTATAALFLPLTLALARRLRLSASRLLMPMAFATIFASSVTLVGTSTNIVISNLVTAYDLPPLGMFELAPVGIPVLIAGLLYMRFVGVRLLPDRSDPNEYGEPFAIRPYLAEVVVLPGSSLVGRSLAESGLGRDLDLTVLRVVRDKNHYLTPRSDLVLEAQDELLVQGLRDQVLQIKEHMGLGIKADVKLSDPRLQAATAEMVEVILLPRSPLVGHTLKELRFRQRYGLQVLGINRRGKKIYRKLSQTPFRIGDQLLVQGARSSIRVLDKNNIFRVVGIIERRRLHHERAPVAVIVFAGVLILAALNILSLPTAVVLGTLGVFLTRCISPEEAYQEVEWKALIVIGSMLALGAAMEHTGTAEFLAAQIVNLSARASPVVLLSAFFALSLLLTQPMSNQAAAVVTVPVAMQTAMQLGLNPRTFAVMIAVGASCSFITPLEPACLMVYGPGGYRFTDFLRVGGPLTLVVYLLAIFLVPLFWPL
ncbi:MAG: SLC13 family permease [Anaerolineales bacterium]